MKLQSRTRNLLNSLLIVGATIFGVASYAMESATQTTQFDVFVPPIVRWVGANQGNATLTLNYDPKKPEQNEVSEIFRLMMNVDVSITAKVTDFTNPDNPSDTLKTFWKINDDKENDPAKTGVLPANADSTQGYDEFVTTRNFLSNGLYVTHQPSDGNVKFTVTARGEKPAAKNLESQETQRYEASIVLTAIPTVGGKTPRFTVR